MPEVSPGGRLGPLPCRSWAGLGAPRWARVRPGASDREPGTEEAAAGYPGRGGAGSASVERPPPAGTRLTAALAPQAPSKRQRFRGSCSRREPAVTMPRCFCVFLPSPPGGVTNPGTEGSRRPRQSSLSPGLPFSRTEALRRQCGPVLDIRVDCPPSAQGQFSAESAPDHRDPLLGLKDP